MSTYLKCSISNIRTNEDWPAPPTSFYIPYHGTSAEAMGNVDHSGTPRTYAAGRHVAGGVITHLTVRAYWTEASFVYWYYGDLSMSNVDYFSPSVVGRHVGYFDTIWDIQKFETYDTVNLPIGYDAEPGTTWLYEPPEVQIGGVPASAITPAPADGETKVKLVLPQLTWSTT